jgi:3-hydroxyisobutyrate dehydrogenase-like beta-hydroxyacid dehydrogenase
MPQPLRLGRIGLGALGSRIAARLLRTGFPLEIYDMMPDIKGGSGFCFR